MNKYIIRGFRLIPKWLKQKKVLPDIPTIEEPSIESFSVDQHIQEMKSMTECMKKRIAKLNEGYTIPTEEKTLFC